MKYRICDNCGKGFLETIVEIGYDDRIFCSKDCLYDYLIINMFVDHVRLISVEDK